MSKRESGEDRSRRRELVWPETATQSGHDFAAGWAESWRLVAWLSSLAAHSDRAAEHAHTVLVKTAKSDEEREGLQSTWAKRKPHLTMLAENRQILLEMLVARHVDNFLAYLSSLLFEVFTSKPETLRSGDTVEVAAVLRYSTIEELVRGLAERKVEKLSRESFDELWEFFDQRLGLRIGTADMKLALGVVVELRHMIVHNKCKASKRFLAKAPEGTTAVLGERYELDLDTCEVLTNLLLLAAHIVDNSARKKFGLKGIGRGKDQPIARASFGEKTRVDRSREKYS